MIFPDDKIKIILREIDFEDKSIRFNDETFQAFIYKFSKIYPDLFDDFSFITSGTFPYSEQVELALTRAKISRVLKTVNPDYEFMQLSKGTNEYIDKYIKAKFSSDQVTKLSEVGKAIRASFNT